MGIFSSSSKVAATTNNTSQGFEDVAGRVVAGNSNRVAFFEGEGAGLQIGGALTNSRIEMSDQGAIDRAFSFAERAVEAERDSVAETLGVAREAIDAGVGFGRAAFEAFATVADDYRGITRDSFELANDLFRQSRDTIAGVAASSQEALSYAITQNATSNDERLRELAKQALFAVVTAAVVPLLFRKWG